VPFLTLEQIASDYIGPDPKREAPAQDETSLILTRHILAAVNKYVLSGEAASDLAKDLEAIRLSLAPSCDPEILIAIAQRLTVLLQTWRERLRRADQESTGEFRKLIHLLNETFSQLISGNDRTDVRLKRLERSLQIAAQIDDIQNLKSHLSEMLAYVRQEAESESAIAQESLHNLERQLRLAQMSASRFRAKRLRREEALAELACESQNQSAAGSLYLGMFVAPSLPAIRSRHGNEIGDFLLEELCHKNLGHLIPSGKIFAWSPNSLLALWRSEDELPQVSKHIANGTHASCKHRAFVGTRTATFSIDLKSLVLRAQEDKEDLIRHLDGFSEAGKAC
jgi:hypothetical protein